MAFECVIVGGLERARVRHWRVSLRSAGSETMIPFPSVSLQKRELCRVDRLTRVGRAGI